MRRPSSNLPRFFALISLSLLLVLPTTAYSASKGNFYKPSVADMTIDLALRPLYFTGTVIGTVIFLVSLPVSAAGGNVDEAAKRLMIEPAAETFLRCLGCQNSDK